MPTQSLSNSQIQSQTQSQKLQLKPLTQTEIRLLRLTQQEFEQDIMTQLDTNPALEESSQEAEAAEDSLDLGTDTEYGADEREFSKEDYDKERIQDYAPDDVPTYYDTENSRERMVATASSFYEQLQEQASGIDLTEKQTQIMDYLIGSLDDDGFLRHTPKKLSQEMEIYEGLEASPDEVAQVLRVLQSFEPAGVGAANVQESLIIQLRTMDSGSPLRQKAIDILSRAFYDYINKHYDKLCQRFKIDRPTLDKIYSIVRHLSPRPAAMGAAMGNGSAIHITPDFVVRETDDGFVVSLAHSRLTTIKLSTAYSSYASASSGNTSVEQAAVRQQVNEAKLYVAAIQLRQNTLLETMKTIVRLQSEYFHTGERTSLQSMTQADVAKLIKRDPSTVSGIVSNKYVDTPFGVIALRDLFTTSFVNQQGDEVSREEVKQQMRQIIDNEDKNNPVSDEELAARLKVARRTIAKYRKIMRIPVARLRR